MAVNQFLDYLPPLPARYQHKFRQKQIFIRAATACIVALARMQQVIQSASRH